MGHLPSDPQQEDTCENGEQPITQGKPREELGKAQIGNQHDHTKGQSANHHKGQLGSKTELHIVQIIWLIEHEQINFSLHQ